MKRIILRCAIVLICWLIATNLSAQHKLYPACFDLDEITLFDSPFKFAQEKNYETLVMYDVDRLLTPYIRQAGLSSTTDANNRYYQWETDHPCFESFAWKPALAMDGHLLGHYLSALSLAYASCKNDLQRRAFLNRIDYIVTVLKDCQSAFDPDKRGMKGFIGGVPDNQIWLGLLQADATIYNEHGNWVPFYCEHKVMAGLRDVVLFTPNTEAQMVFKKMCDWVTNIVSRFSEGAMDIHILQWETGGMNEVLADAYDIFHDSKYLRAAQKFSHRLVMESINSDEYKSFLDKKNTNELTAMVLGYSRLCKIKTFRKFFNSVNRYWEEVVNHRCMANGGVGVGGYFVPKGEPLLSITDGDGPDLCTTYNMLKLSESLFAVSYSPKYADYYEKALLNHVLASIDPETGGFTYFTSLRPESYRIYSKMNESMWCCVGTGMEMQSKYGEFIYTRNNEGDTLYVNLFIPSELNSEKIALTQQSSYPYGERSTITINKSGNYELAIRHPSWASNGYNVTVNGKPVKFKPELATPGYNSFIYCGKGWKAGDVIEVNYPMELTYESCPDNPDYIALRYGPNLLAAQTTSRNQADSLYEFLPREFGGAGQHDFSPQSRVHFRSLAYAPMLICEMPEVPQRVKLLNRNRLEFAINAKAIGSPWDTVRVRPFFDLHHTRYSVYWNRQSQGVWLRNPLFKDQLRTEQLESLTYDLITPGNLDSEREHNLEISETGSRGSWNGKTFRDAQPGQWFEYTFDTKKAAPVIHQGKEVALVCMFSSGDRGRSFILSVDGKDIEYYEIPKFQTTIGKSRFFEHAFKLPSALLDGKQNIILRFSSTEGNFVPRFYQMRLMKYEEDLLQ